MVKEKTLKPIIEYRIDFLEYLEIEKGLSNKTQETYSRFLNKFFQWLKDNKLEKLEPHQLTSEHIWDYRVFLSRKVNSKTKEPLKKTTQNRHLIVLRNLLNFFANRDISALPSEKIKLAKESKDKRVKFLTPEQVEKLLSAPNVKTLTGLRDRAILESLFSSGMRVSELTSIDREQLKITPLTKDLEISILGKGNHTRTVYFSEEPLEWLKKYLATRNDKEKALFIRYKGPTNSPLRLTIRSIEDIVKKYAIQSGIPLFTVPHTLRHSFATDLLTKGVDIRVVQEFLGHKSIATTQIYTHVTSKRLRDIHRKFHGRK